MRVRWVLLCICFYLLTVVSAAKAADDNENSTPTGWWIYTGQSYTDVVNTINSKKARIIDIKLDNPSSGTYTVTYVQNTGSYAKAWWWYVGIDANTLATRLSVNNARLISLFAYDIGGGNIRFDVAMISNTGADAKGWWYYYGQTPTEIANLTRNNNARLTTLQSYSSNGQTAYSAIMIANTGADAKGWWWYYNVSGTAISGYVSTNHARLLDVTPVGNGNFNAVMESCSTGCPSWWWWYGVSASGVLYKAQNVGARVLTNSPYACGTSVCFAAVMIANSPADITACDPNGCVSEKKLRSNICGALAGHVVGYSCEVGGMPPSYGGLARTATDAPTTAMAPDLVTNIASVSKTMTAVAILQLLAKDGLTIDAKISPYIYKDWKQGSNISQLTFKELLTHSSGFSQQPGAPCGGSITYSTLETIVANGVYSSDIGHPSYGNCNFALLRELMPALQGQSLLNYANGSQRAQQSSALYISYVNKHVFNPVSVPTSACKPPAGTNHILSYPYPAGSTAGTDWGDWSLQCGGGGWVLSGDEIFRVINDLATGNTLLTSTQRKQMFSNCLGWDCAVRSDCPNGYVCKNGDLYNGLGTSVWTYAGVLGCNVPVVVVVNSPLPSPYQTNGDIIELVANAYKNAAVPGTPKACP